jgi:lysozyme family protein
MSHHSIKITSGVKPVERQDRTQHIKSKTAKDSFSAVLSSAQGQMEEVQRSSEKNFYNIMTPEMSIAAPIETSPDAKFKNILSIVMKHEGTSYVRKDGGRESSKMGILQSTAREYGYKGDIRNISKDEAEGIYKKIWDKSGAADLPYPLSVVHFDTYVNSPAAARKILKQSGGDIDTYLGKREKRFIRLAAMRPHRYGRYLKGWIDRVNDLRSVVAEYAKINEASKIETASAKSVDTRA